MEAGIKRHLEHAGELRRATIAQRRGGPLLPVGARWGRGMLPPSVPPCEGGREKGACEGGKERRRLARGEGRGDLRGEKGACEGICTIALDMPRRNNVACS